MRCLLLANEHVQRGAIYLHPNQVCLDTCSSAAGQCLERFDVFASVFDTKFQDINDPTSWLLHATGSLLAIKLSCVLPAKCAPLTLRPT